MTDALLHMSSEQDESELLLRLNWIDNLRYDATSSQSQCPLVMLKSDVLVGAAAMSNI